jgi:protein SCO1/2
MGRGGGAAQARRGGSDALMARRRPRRTTIRRGRSLLASALAGCALLAAALIVYHEAIRPPAAAASIGGPFELIDQDGNTVTDATYRGKWLLVYFGYTYCPDACPTALNDMAEALAELDGLRARVQPLFITIDPERDTQAVLKPYVAAFDAGIGGLTGSAEQIAKVAREYRIEYRRDGATGGAYGMAHSSAIFLIDPNGRFVTKFGQTTAPETIAATLRRAMS